MKILFASGVFLLASCFATQASANAIIWGPNGQALSIADQLFFPGGYSTATISPGGILAATLGDALVDGENGKDLVIKAGNTFQDGGTSGVAGNLRLQGGLEIDTINRGKVYIDGELNALLGAKFVNGITSNRLDLSDGDSSDNVRLFAPAVTTQYDIIFPPAQGAANTFLKNDGTGALTWSNAASSACTYKVATTTGTAITATCTGSNYPVSGGCSTAGAGVLASSASDPAPTDGQAADVPTGWACTYTVSGSVTAYALCCSP